MRRRHLLAASAALAAPALRPAAAQAAVTMRLSHQFPPAHHNARVIAAFAEDVKARSNGQVAVQVFPAEQLAKAGENFPGVARGAFEAAAAVNFQWGTTIPEMNAPTIPYLFTDIAKIRRFPGSEAAKFLEGLLARRAVMNLMWLYTTRQSIFTSNRKPIITLADFQGMKIRGLNALTDHALTAVGAAPSAMPGPEVSPALQSGVLDAGLTDVSAAVSRRYYEIQKFGTVAPYFSVISHVYVNPRWFSGLAAPHRAAIEAAARKAEQDQMDVTEATAASAVGTLRERGMTIHEQTAAETATWTATMQPPVIAAFNRLAPEGGPRSIELLRAIPTA
ncbi:TRAP transporter substrate-binding protein DctP [Falsiroseomonas selenitidurans]|uniref:TRAP transporter substrate-binding protein DctP n=1 Tax=Falsiroseomonas selenitidurans TaxID=2716335 RepID=A0ABX1E6J4_9PROT|nr:TRAP transporter substrate-binding protein DctP [Falsiroseomonas selenitidurans]NKC32814.1 TRAP transporter substrate-binding protein DctP [Falsiroseomonas selenitidurans]